MATITITIARNIIVLPFITDCIIVPAIVDHEGSNGNGTPGPNISTRPRSPH